MSLPSQRNLLTSPEVAPVGVRELLERAVAASASGVTVADVRLPDAPLVYVNPAFERLTGYRAEEALGHNCRLLQGPETDVEAVRALGAAIAEGQEYRAVLRNYQRGGRPWWNELHLSPVRDAGGQVTHYLGFQHDVTDRVEAEQRVAHLAYHDPLTGLPNRARLTEQLDIELVRARRSGHGVAVLFFDLDGFKAVNDEHGHAVGDLVLVEASRRLRSALRAGDLMARHGGDEFIAVLADIPDEHVESAATRVAEAAVHRLTEPVHLSDRSVLLGASAGVALFGRHGLHAAELLSRADGAMYVAKAAGRACVRVAPEVVR